VKALRVRRHHDERQSTSLQRAQLTRTLLHRATHRLVLVDEAALTRFVHPRERVLVELLYLAYRDRVVALDHPVGTLRDAEVGLWLPRVAVRAQIGVEPDLGSGRRLRVCAPVGHPANLAADQDTDASALQPCGSSARGAGRVTEKGDETLVEDELG